MIIIKIIIITIIIIIISMIKIILVYLRKVLTLIDLGKFNNAQETVDELLKFEPTNSEALYLKGLA